MLARYNDANLGIEQNTDGIIPVNLFEFNFIYVKLKILLKNIGAVPIKKLELISI